MTNRVAAFLAGLIITIGNDGLCHNYDLVGRFAVAMGFSPSLFQEKLK